MSRQESNYGELDAGMDAEMDARHPHDDPQPIAIETRVTRWVPEVAHVG